MKEKKAKKIIENLKSTFEDIAEDFSNTRQYAGKDFDFFSKYVKNDANIIDLGCGNGRLLLWLNKQPIKFTYTGVDSSEKLLNIAIEKFPTHTFLHGDITALPIESRKFNNVFCIRAFHHIPSEKLRLQALAEMRRLLKKKGILILTVWNLWHKKNWKYVSASLMRSAITLGIYEYNDMFIPWGKGGKSNTQDEKPAKVPMRYYHAFTPIELKHYLLKSGFEIKKLFGVAKGEKVDLKDAQDFVIIAQK